MAFGAIGLAAPAADAAVARCDGRRVRTLPFATGELRLYKSHSYACAVTFAKNPGKRRHMTVSIQARGSRPRVDSGYYILRAGPVRVAATTRCVLVRGSVAGVSVSTGWTLC